MPSHCKEPKVVGDEFVFYFSYAAYQALRLHKCKQTRHSQPKRETAQHRQPNGNQALGYLTVRLDSSSVQGFARRNPAAA